MKGLIRLIKLLNLKQLTGVAGFFFRHPLLFLSAVVATSQCVILCDRIFGKSHHKNNKANAYRHALWNMMLLRNALRLGRDPKKASEWSKALTDWHEDFSPNSTMARTMDLHNNAVGRQLYLTNFKEKPVKNIQITKALVPLLKTAKKLTKKEDMLNHKGHLVYLKESNE